MDFNFVLFCVRNNMLSIITCKDKPRGKADMKVIQVPEVVILARYLPYLSIYLCRLILKKSGYGDNSETLEFFVRAIPSENLLFVHFSFQ